jgi:hypothetical protein
LFTTDDWPRELKLELALATRVAPDPTKTVPIKPGEIAPKVSCPPLMFVVVDPISDALIAFDPAPKSEVMEIAENPPPAMVALLPERKVKVPTLTATS